MWWSQSHLRSALQLSPKVRLSSRTHRHVKTGGKVFFKVNIPGTFTHQTETDVNTKTALPIISDAQCGCY